MNLIPINSNAPHWIKVLYILYEARLTGDHTKGMPSGFLNIPDIRRRIEVNNWYVDAIGQRISNLRLQKGFDDYLKGETFTCSKSKGWKLLVDLTVDDWIEIKRNVKTYRYQPKGQLLLIPGGRLID